MASVVGESQLTSLWEDTDGLPLRGLTQTGRITNGVAQAGPPTAWRKPAHRQCSASQTVITVISCTLEPCYRRTGAT